ncbi:putative hydroquinone glucosyltransferase [Helianthus annuus]|uniref:Glycosyltransferase n=1 Tax=Helianthus annuus TaxID=4232 RepID=A0A251UG85_HELAN|nr:hydroquinone glucosyltransferase [Helianthus annuus]KAF5801304.1 putative hydroquinone glucosyltransferase [Helianthus annuus]KAJ0565660.1 putative hydroquinone glucosyltransferase [Helianthus annuus]KAJ0739953.1 putative hydroquinone glucosyltransferase [Helianthus annuus]KAJ0910750.1 putative hydroquinone glucosyltransferase [Helianthus annuus]
MERTPHIAIVPSPGMGHLIPLVEFAKRLKNNHNISSTFIIPNEGPLTKSQQAFLDSLPNGLNHVILPPVSFDDLPNDIRMETRISLMVTRSLDSLREAVKSLVVETNMVALFVDLFGTDAFDVAIEFGVSPYVFFPSTAMALSLFLYLPKLDQMVSCEYRDLPEPVQIPGCIPVRGEDLLDPVQERKNDAYKWVLHNAKRYRMAEGIAVNSFKELEGGALKALLEDQPGKPRVYPVGPLVQAGSSSDVDGSGCLRWLDGQPCGSVLYISFGSGGTLSSNQLNELALGLELSEQRFIWVVRSPNDKPNATYFNSHGHEDPLGFLPKGFLERTKGIGFVVPSWAPQAQILSHSSTGGFLTHCGWNSILETVVHGVPVIAWPLYAEQRMNAVSLTEGIKVALRPKVDENGIVSRVEIARVVKGLIEGEEGKPIRSRIRELKDAASNVLSKDGCSTKTLEQLASKLKAKNNISI